MASDVRVAIVTGASSGIGQACAESLAAAGFLVYGTSRRSDFRPGTFRALAMDVTDDESVTRAIDTVLTAHGRVDCVVNSAGYGLGGAVEDTSIAEARAQLEANFFGIVRTCRAVLPAMRRDRSGVIVNISSLGGLFGLPWQGLYSASKFAVEGLSESLRLETRQFGIHVVLIEPGDVRTRITANRVFAARSGSDSAYAEAVARTFAIVEKEEGKGAAARDVGELVARVARARRPRLRYTVGHQGQRLTALLKRALPWSVCERLLLSFYGVTPAAIPPRAARRSGPASSPTP